MTGTVGPGDFVQAVVSSFADRIRRGEVRLVTAVSHPKGKSPCRSCGYYGAGYELLGLTTRPGAVWCPNHWRPYHGPAEPVRVCQEVKEPA